MARADGGGAAREDTRNGNHEGGPAQDVPLGQGQPARPEDGQERPLKPRAAAGDRQALREGAQSEALGRLHREGARRAGADELRGLHTPARPEDRAHQATDTQVLRLEARRGARRGAPRARVERQDREGGRAPAGPDGLLRLPGGRGEAVGPDEGGPVDEDTLPVRPILQQVHPGGEAGTQAGLVQPGLQGR